MTTQHCRTATVRMCICGARRRCLPTPGIERDVAQSARWHWQWFPHAKLEPGVADRTRCEHGRLRWYLVSSRVGIRAMTIFASKVAVLSFGRVAPSRTNAI